MLAQAWEAVRRVRKHLAHFKSSPRREERLKKTTPAEALRTEWTNTRCSVSRPLYRLTERFRVASARKHTRKCLESRCTNDGCLYHRAAQSVRRNLMQPPFYKTSPDIPKKLIRHVALGRVLNAYTDFELYSFPPSPPPAQG